MSLSSHIDLLVCPACHGALTVAGEEVSCEQCLRRYPIVDELPVLIESRVLSADKIRPRVPDSASN